VHRTRKRDTGESPPACVPSAKAKNGSSSRNRAAAALIRYPLFLNCKPFFFKRDDRARARLRRDNLQTQPDERDKTSLTTLVSKWKNIRIMYWFSNRACAVSISRLLVLGFRVFCRRQRTHSYLDLPAGLSCESRPCEIVLLRRREDTVLARVSK
jgi:hypothetical protein